MFYLTCSGFCSVLYQPLEIIHLILTHPLKKVSADVNSTKQSQEMSHFQSWQKRNALKACSVPSEAKRGKDKLKSTIQVLQLYHGNDCH